MCLIKVEPSLTIILVINANRERPQDTINSVLGQTIIERIEFLIFDLAGADAPSLSGFDHPSVHVIPTSPLKTVGEIRTEAIRRARAPYLAFLEDHVLINVEWAQFILDAFASGDWAGIATGMRVGNPHQGPSDALNLMNHIAWQATNPAGETSNMPGNNSTYRREALLALGEALPTALLGDLLVQRLLRERGCRFYFEPRAELIHLNEATIYSALDGLFVHCRALSYAQAELERWSLARRLPKVLLLPAAPLLRTWRAYGNVAHYAPKHCDEFWRSAPVILLMQASCALGQAVGLIAGLGRAGIRFLEYETTAERGHWSYE